MSEPRHVSTCISEWLDDYETKCPFNLPDALAAIRDELTARDRTNRGDEAMSTNEPTDAEIEAAARQMWRDEHGSISSPDHFRTPESDEREKDRSGYGWWDRGVAEPVRKGYRRRARAALAAAARVRPTGGGFAESHLPYTQEMDVHTPAARPAGEDTRATGDLAGALRDSVIRVPMARALREAFDRKWQDPDLHNADTWLFAADAVLAEFTVTRKAQP